jgi:hypothetical protein
MANNIKIVTNVPAHGFFPKTGLQPSKHLRIWRKNGLFVFKLSNSAEQAIANIDVLLPDELLTEATVTAKKTL